MLSQLKTFRRAWTKKRSLKALRRQFHQALSGQGAEGCSFQCNICGLHVEAPRASVAGRETVSCYGCGSTLRFRSVVHGLSLALFGEPVALPDFPAGKALRGVGMSDDACYAGRLGGVLDYTNTFYHREPRLDVASAPPERWRHLDFIISSEVFEHVPPPVDQAFRHLRAMLKPGGTCIFSVPFREEGRTVEHFPDLHEYRLDREEGRAVLSNRTREGQEQVFRDLRFHGGAGSTLEMRVFSRSGLQQEAMAAGFDEVVLLGQDFPPFGIFWEGDAAPPFLLKTA